MPNALWQYGILDPRKRGRTLSLRAPDDPLAYEDDGPPIVRSPAVNERIADYLYAMREGDASGRAMNAIIDTHRADHAMSGVPVYAHTPLPDDFVERIIEPLARLPAARRSPALTTILEDAGPDRRPVVRNQLNEKLLAATAIVSGMSEELRPFWLMGGDEGDGGGVSAGPRVPQKESPPPAPRPKPGGGQADCDSIRTKHAGIRSAITDFEQRRAAAERQLSGLLQQRNGLLSEQREVSAALAEARSRSTDPPTFLMVCPSNPNKGRPPGKPDGNEVGCGLVGPIISDEAEKFWKRRLEDQKGRDIARLEAELRAFPERFSRLDKAIGEAQAAVDDAKDGLYRLHLGLTEQDNKYESQCGNPRELWPD